MIIREWRARASLAQAEAYPSHFRTKVVPDLKLLPGFVGVHLSRRRLGDGIEFLVLTRWKSMDAIRAFAGSEIDNAVVEPGAAAALIDFHAKVQHYEVTEEALSSPRAATRRARARIVGRAAQRRRAGYPSRLA